MPWSSGLQEGGLSLSDPSGSQLWQMRSLSLLHRLAREPLELGRGPGSSAHAGPSGGAHHAGSSATAPPAGRPRPRSGPRLCGASANPRPGHRASGQGPSNSADFLTEEVPNCSSRESSSAGAEDLSQARRCAPLRSAHLWPGRGGGARCVRFPLARDPRVTSAEAGSARCLTGESSGAAGLVPRCSATTRLACSGGPAAPPPPNGLLRVVQLVPVQVVGPRGGGRDSHPPPWGLSRLCLRLGLAGRFEARSLPQPPRWWRRPRHTSRILAYGLTPQSVVQLAIGLFLQRTWGHRPSRLQRAGRAVLSGPEVTWGPAAVPGRCARGPSLPHFLFC